MSQTEITEFDNGHMAVEDDGPSQSEVFESLSKGDKIQFECKGSHNTKGAHTVQADEHSGGLLAIEGPGGGSKMLVRNKHDPDNISVMSMKTINDDGNWISDLRVVG